MPSLRVPSAPAHRSVAPKSADQFWPIFRDLVEVREVLGLARPVLTTLRALISFMERGTVVFASNHKICERAEGISQSSLRRHVKALVEAGLANRIDSPNGKRFALRTSGLEDMVFGIDLSPLLERADELSALTITLREEQARLRHLRKILGHLIWQASESAMSAEELLPFRQALRRKMKFAELSNLIEDLTSLLKTSLFAEEMTASANQSDCHTHNQKEEIRNKGKSSNLSFAPTPTELQRVAEQIAPDAVQLLKAELNGDPQRSAYQLAKWTGITEAVIKRSLDHAGAEITLLGLLLVVQNIDRIHNPAAYFTATTIGSRQFSFLRNLQKCLVRH